MEQAEQSWRHRINVTRNTKGKSWDCTVEGIGHTLDEALAESDRLVAELEHRYDTPVTEGIANADKVAA